MPQDAITRCLGLVTQYNPHQVAPGALIQADNCVIDRENIVEDRRGYSAYLTLSNSIASLFVYSSKILAHNGTKISYPSGVTSADYAGSYSAPSGRKMRALEAFNNCYITTDAGIQVLTDTTGTAAVKAGAPRSLDGSYSLTGASGFLTDAYQCAYRFVIQRTDANSNVKFGYPSTRMWVTNSAGGSRNVEVTLYLPAEVTTSDVLQVYRTAIVSGTSSDDAGDEMSLVYQVNPTSTDITNGYMTFTDSVVDDLRGAALYTSPSQEGIAQANDRPPLAKDIALYKSGFMFYANTSTKQRLYFTLVGTGSLSGKTITLAGVTYNFGASEIISGAGAPQAKVSATGIAAADIDLTARSLVKVINRYASNTGVYAYYTSGPEDLPGQIVIEERGIGAAAYTLQASDSAISAMIFPQPPVSPATSSKSTSSNQVQKNAVYFSKFQQPEAVPMLNYLLVGASNKEILRIAPLRNSLVIVKEEGVYLLTGDTPQSFSVNPLDLTVFCKSPDSVAVLANTVIMLSNQGVVQITESGVTVISREIEPNIKPLLGFTNISTLAIACAYESDRAYLLSLPTFATDTASNQVYRYNIFTRTWTHWTFGFTTAVIEPASDVMYFAKPLSAIIHKERKSFTDADYADPEYTITVLSVDTAKQSITFTSATTPNVGDAVKQGDTTIPIGTLNVGPGYYTAVMTTGVPASWAAGSATVFPGVGLEVVWDAWTGQGAAGMLKQVSEVAILADNISGNNTATVIVPTFASNFDQNREEITYPLAGGYSGGWGGAWGNIPWGGGGDSYGYRTFVPRNKQFCRILNPGVRHKNAMERFSCAGVAINYEGLSERIGR